MIYRRVVFLFFFFFFLIIRRPPRSTLSLHDALPIWPRLCGRRRGPHHGHSGARDRRFRDRKSTRLNSSHTVISYAVFCLKKKNICHIKSIKNIKILPVQLPSFYFLSCFLTYESTPIY